jgi:hypothetical protein
MAALLLDLNLELFSPKELVFAVFLDLALFRELLIDWFYSLKL